MLAILTVVGTFKMPWNGYLKLMPLPENRITPTELPTEIFRRQFLPTEIIPSQILLVLADGKNLSAMLPVYTDGIILLVYTGGEKFFLKIATAG
jgi:hypothetical protein